MSGDELTVSGGGMTAVAVDELFADAARLGTAEAVIVDWNARAGVIRRGIGALDLHEPAAGWRDPTSPTWFLQLADVGLDQAADRARALYRSLLEAAERYGATERMIDGLWRLGAALAAPWIGASLLSPAVMAGGLLVGGGQWAGSAVWRGLGWGPTPLASWLAEHRDLLSDPAFVRLVRLAADHADELAAGALHAPVPAPVIAMLGAGVGAPESASALLGLAGVAGLFGSRVLVDGPVRVARSDGPAVSRVEPPNGLGELAERVPPPDRNEPQLRVERYGDAGDPRFIVYIGGTVEPVVVSGAEPFDHTSNAHGVADDSWVDALRPAGADTGAGERAARQAMTAAGVRPGDPLLLVGYSAGGIVAAKLAADPGLGAVGVVNLGGPVASAPTREGVGLLSFEHEEDLVPATGGAGHPADERVTVTRSVLDPGSSYDALLPAHELARYRETAALADESDEARLARFRELVAEVTGDAPGERTDWIATRDVSLSTGER
ncbi:hypothetical protein [Agromyces bauzanensis]|uniref:Alpha/beta hydrolase n=1 Tax=Agromyces bauzanensis TaxID=1308924 RepID=A0A917PMM6_9MICO|nr:hypothetical protein [Agromyces bauzanensis]GGJ84414.1 hypothetical protein GCM10011372_23380 [Agromyces bauzanensis]